MTTHRQTLVLGALAVAATALVPAGAPAAPSSAPVATAASTCKLTADEQYHRANNRLPTYTRKLTASGGATCSTAHKFIKAYYKCRVAAPSSGKKGRCTSKVMGYSCTEKRSNVISSQFDASVSCKNGRARITTQYTQFT
jgi:hypothetical protein